jgi:riboflavin kinase/FMN adenylyltransferase
MHVSRGLAAHRRQTYPVLTIGNFDGQHVGHRALLDLVVRRAAAMNGTPMVLTFDPHPVMVLAPQVVLQFLTSKEEKLQRFADAGIADVVILEFTQALAGFSPERFVKEMLVDGIGVKELFVGEHFSFGKGKAGRIADLRKAGDAWGFTVHAVTPVPVDGRVVSSTGIRSLIQRGEVREAARWLGRGYTLNGTVIRGRQRGTTMGWPTANLALPPGRVIPPDGVYATKVIHGKAEYNSVAYVGARPTFGGGERLLEAYLLDTELDLYGQSVSVTFVDRLRDDRTFDSAEALSAQIRLDVERARDALRQAGSPCAGVAGGSR